MGIEELKDVVFSGLKIGEALADGIQVTDVAALVSLPEAISGITDVPAEIADLDDAESDELKRFVQDNFDIPDDEVEQFVEKAVAVVIQLYGLYLAFKVLKKTE